MGNPSIKLRDKTIIVDGFFFNIGMTVFREQCEKRKATLSANSVMSNIAIHIEKLGYEHIADTVFYFDAFVAAENHRADLIQWLKELRGLVLRPGFQLPEMWQKALRNDHGKAPPIPVTRDHFIGIAYVYQMMIDLIEGKIEEKLVKRLRPPPDWEPNETP